MSKLRQKYIEITRYIWSNNEIVKLKLRDKFTSNFEIIEVGDRKKI